VTAYHGNYPDIGKFTGLTEGEHLLQDIEKKVTEMVEINSQPTNPFSEDIVKLYEPLRKSFLEDHKDKCNVLFKVKVYPNPMTNTCTCFASIAYWFLLLLPSLCCIGTGVLQL